MRAMMGTTKSLHSEDKKGTVRANFHQPIHLKAALRFGAALDNRTVLTACISLPAYIRNGQFITSQNLTAYHTDTSFLVPPKT
jgi:hypothetical protein